MTGARTVPAPSGKASPQSTNEPNPGFPFPNRPRSHGNHPTHRAGPHRPRDRRTLGRLCSRRVGALPFSSEAGILPGPLVGVAFSGGVLLVVALMVAVWRLPPSWPRLPVRLLLIAGMGGAFWSVGTIVRGLYALTL